MKNRDGYWWPPGPKDVCQFEERLLDEGISVDDPMRASNMVTLARGLGYDLIAGPGEARLWPAFTAALLEPDKGALRDRFDDLWAVDISLWIQLCGKTVDPLELRDTWRHAPGRRLATKSSALSWFVSSTGLPKSSERILDAVFGPPWADDLPPGYLELHADLRQEGDWRPAGPCPQRRALELLSRGTLPSLRSAALGWLLSCTGREAHYRVGKVARNVEKDDLPLALEMLFQRDNRDGWYSKPWLHLEASLLAHGSQFTESETLHPKTLRVARWMFGILSRSPAYPNDPGSLAALVLERLPEGEDRRPKLSLDQEYFELEEYAQLCLLAALYGFHGKQDKFRTTPMPIVEELRRLASLKSVEIHSPSNETEPLTFLRQKLPYRSVELLARRLLTKLKLHWIQHLDENIKQEVLDDCLKLAIREPGRSAWVADAMVREASSLDPRTRNAITMLWADYSLGKYKVQLEHLLAKLSPLFIADLPPDEQDMVLDIVLKVGGGDRAAILDEVADEGTRSEQTSLWTGAMNRLQEHLDMEAQELRNSKKNEETLTEAAELMLKQASGMIQQNGDQYLRHLDCVLDESDLSVGGNLKYEIKRILDDETSRGGEY